MTSISSFILSMILSSSALGYYILGAIILAVGIVILLTTKNEYHIISLKSGAHLKLDQLIIFVCAMSMAISYCLWIDINHHALTGEFSYFSAGPVLYLVLMSVLVSIRMKRYNGNQEPKRPSCS